MEIQVKIQIAPGKNLNLIEKIFPLIHTFDHKGPKVVIIVQALK